MKKIFIILASFGIVCVTLFLFLTIYLSYGINYNKIYSNFIEIAKIEHNSLNNSGFVLKKFPLPHLVIKEINWHQRINLKNVKIYIPLFSSYSKITAIKISEATIYLSDDEVDLLNHDKLIAHFLNQNSFNTNITINKLLISNKNQENLMVVENFILVEQNDLTRFTGNINAIYNLTGTVTRKDNDADFSLAITGQDNAIELTEQYHNNLLLTGKASITTNNWGSIIRMLSANIDPLLISKINNEKITINFGFTNSAIDNNDNNLTNSTKTVLNFNNINISSPSVNATAEITLSNNQSQPGKINIRFSQINLPTLLNFSYNNTNSTNIASDPAAHNTSPDKNINPVKGLDTDKELYDRNTSDYYPFKFNFYPPLQVNITVDSLHINENNILAKVVTNINITDDKLYIQQGTGDITQNQRQTGRFMLNGIVTNNTFRSLFNGKISISDLDINNLIEPILGTSFNSSAPVAYSLITDVKISAVDLSLQNLFLKTADSEITGNISTKYIGSSPRVNSDLKITFVNLDQPNLPLIDYLVNTGLDFTKNTKDVNYIDKFISIRKINSLLNYDINIDQLIAGGKTYHDMKFNITFGAGEVKVDNLVINRDNDYIEAGLTLDAKGIKPIITLNIYNGSVGISSFPLNYLLGPGILDYLALDKIDLAVNCTLTKLYQHGSAGADFSLDNISFQGRNDKTLLEISKFDTDIFGGRLKSSGDILLTPYSLNVVYYLTAAKASTIIHLLSDKLLTWNLTKDSIITAQGTVSTYGNKPDEQLYNLSTDSAVNLKNITITNFSIDQLAQKITTANYDPKNLDNDIKSAILTGTTDIDELTGRFQLSKGVISTNVKFNTERTATGTTGTINIYDFGVNLSSVFSFYVNQTASSTLKVNTGGTIFAPKKEADSTEITKFFMQNHNK